MSRVWWRWSCETGLHEGGCPAGTLCQSREACRSAALSACTARFRNLPLLAPVCGRGGCRGFARFGRAPAGRGHGSFCDSAGFGVRAAVVVVGRDCHSPRCRAGFARRPISASWASRASLRIHLGWCFRREFWRFAPSGVGCVCLSARAILSDPRLVDRLADGRGFGNWAFWWLGLSPIGLPRFWRFSVSGSARLGVRSTGFARFRAFGPAWLSAVADQFCEHSSDPEGHPTPGGRRGHRGLLGRGSARGARGDRSRLLRSGCWDARW